MIYCNVQNVMGSFEVKPVDKVNRPPLFVVDNFATFNHFLFVWYNIFVNKTCLCVTLDEFLGSESWAVVG